MTVELQVFTMTKVNIDEEEHIWEDVMLNLQLEEEYEMPLMIRVLNKIVSVFFILASMFLLFTAPTATYPDNFSLYIGGAAFLIMGILIIILERRSTNKERDK